MIGASHLLGRPSLPKRTSAPRHQGVAQERLVAHGAHGDGVQTCPRSPAVRAFYF